MTSTVRTPLTSPEAVVSTPSSPSVSPAPGSLLRARFSGLGGPFWVVMAGTMMNRLGAMVLPFLVFFLAARHVPTDRIPFVLGALGLGGLFGPVLGGLVTDRLGARAAMVCGMLATAGSQGLLFVAPNLATLALATLALGAGGTLHMPGASSVVAGAAEGERRRVAFGLLHWAINVGTAVAGAIGGFLAEHGYGLLFALDAGTCLAYGALVAAKLPRTPRAGRSVTAGGGYGVVLRDRVMLALLVPVLTGEAVYALTEFTLPLAIRDHGLPPTVYGLAAAVNAVLVVALQPVANLILTRFDRNRLWAFGSALVTAGVALTGTAGSTLGFVLTVAVWSLGEVVASGLYGSMVADLAPADATGRYQGAAGWARGLARFGALLFGSAVYAAFGPPALWWGALTLGLAGSAVAVLIGRRFRTRVS
ncbi:MFS transporter [Kitasatospora viridis]|uniref:Putative MFS family arabinose efflux permease n=1 Tax=Kitasatospora viridis TaxID=281105 RepID=A0A561UDA4_9ACTN|nr:MFS transporter [Kitasatospora viridis]TWF97337.1 putative MFS family arabinose efflux permease [Kitasatospora viridis]